jgi:threonine dehydratase
MSLASEKNKQKAADWPTFDNILQAAERIRKVVKHTDLELNLNFSERYEANIYFKREDLQVVRSYKIRGAYNKMASLSAEALANGVVCASAGNHAQGVAFAARELGIKATIFMPVGVPLPKLQATKDYGAEVVLRGHTVDEPLRAAAEFARAR